jgi:hypothetical protein
MISISTNFDRILASTISVVSILSIVISNFYRITALSRSHQSFVSSYCTTSSLDNRITLNLSCLTICLRWMHAFSLMLPWRLLDLMRASFLHTWLTLNWQWLPIRILGSISSTRLLLITLLQCVVSIVWTLVNCLLSHWYLWLTLSLRSWWPLHRLTIRHSLLFASQIGLIICIIYLWVTLLILLWRLMSISATLILLLRLLCISFFKLFYLLRCHLASNLLLLYKCTSSRILVRALMHHHFTRMVLILNVSWNHIWLWMMTLLMRGVRMATFICISCILCW